MRPKFFASPDKWRRWLVRNHHVHDELWVGFYKRDSGRPSITWPQSVDEALCFGWIDGVRKSLDEISYVIRFTPRRQGSIWSSVNTKRVADLIRQGLMQPAGLRAFGTRKEAKSGIYGYEQRQGAKLPPKYLQRLGANAAARKFFQAQPPWYLRTATWWVISAKKEETRQKRLTILIKDSANGQRIAPLRRISKAGS